MIAVRRVGRDAFFNFAGQAAPLVVGALTIPLTIRWLGIDRFGVLALMWVLIGYLNVFDLGLARATTKFVAAAIGKREPDIASLVGTALATNALLGLVGAIGVWAAAPALVDRILNLPTDLAEEARRAFSVLALSLPVALFSTSLRGVLEAARRFDLVNIVRAPLGGMNFLIPLVGAGAGWQLSGIVFAIFLLQIMGAVIHYILCIRVFPVLRRPRVEFRRLKKLLAFGGWVAVSGIVGPLLVYLDRFAIGALLSVAAAGQYAAPHEVVTRLSIIPMSLVAVLFPLFSAEVLRRTHIEALAVRSLRTLLLTMGAVSLVTLTLADDIVRFWLGVQFQDVVTLPLQILSVGVFINSLAYVPYTLLQARGRPDITGKLHLVELPLHFGLVWVLVSSFGIVGAATAWSIRVTIDATLLFIAAARFGHLSYRSLSSGGLPALAAGVAVLGMVALGISIVPSLPVRVCALLLTLGGAALVLLPSGLARPARSLLLGSSSRT
jgi:O-antigen/teichoic acid export membrane protein